MIHGEDPMKESRSRFFGEYLYPKDGMMPSERIIYEIEKLIYDR